LASSRIAEVHSVVLQAIEDLEKASLNWALVGGLAVSARGAPRFTGDVDFAVAVANDRDAEAATFRMQRRGYVVLMTVEHKQVGRLSTVRLRGPGRPRVVVDLLFAACGLEPEIVARATPSELVSGAIVPVARLGHLLAMKVLALDDKRRPQDRADINALAPLADRAELKLARDSLARIQARGYGGRKKLVTLFDRLVAEANA